MPIAQLRRVLQRHRRFVVYAAVGGATALLYLAVALALTHGLAVAPFQASLAGFAAALPFSYLGHKFLTFGSREEHRRELPRFIASAVVGFFASAGVPELAVRLWGWSPEAGYLAACVVVPALNYLLLSLWVFVNRHEHKVAGEAAAGPARAATQKYAPYRSVLLAPEQLRDLNRLASGRVVRDTLLLWLQIVAAWAAVALWPSWWMVLLAIPVIGTRYYGLYIIGHDGLHRRLFGRVSVNDLWNDALIIGAIGAITRINRSNHMRHHAALALPHDPDRYKYVAANKPTRISYGLALTGLPYLLRAVGNVLAPNRPAGELAKPQGPRLSYTPRDLAILAGWQAALLGGLSWVIGWWAYPVLWLLPVYVFTYSADIVRVFLEHSVPGSDAEADAGLRLVTYRSNPVERRFFAPMNMNFHTAHHLWPSIPYYNLPEADRLIRQSPGRDDGLVWRDSYLVYLLDYGCRLPWHRRADAPAEARAEPGR
jgi:fatty acid desaturase/putative flippase GtrA